MKMREIVFNAWFIVFSVFAVFINLGWFQPFLNDMNIYLHNDILYLIFFAITATGFVDYTSLTMVQWKSGNPSIFRFFCFFIWIYSTLVCISVPLELYVWRYDEITLASSPKGFIAIVLIFIQLFYSCYMISVFTYPELYLAARVVAVCGGIVILVFGFYLPLHAYDYFYSFIEFWFGGFLGGMFCLIFIVSMVIFLLRKVIPFIRRFQEEPTTLDISKNKFINEFLHPSFIAISLLLWIVLFEKNIAGYGFALDFIRGIIPLRFFHLLVPPINYLNLAIGIATIILFYVLTG